jgi:hypothetical protein
MNGDHDRDRPDSIDGGQQRDRRATRTAIWGPVMQVIRMLVIPAPDLDDRATPGTRDGALIPDGRWRPVLDPPEADAGDLANR